MISLKSDVGELKSNVSTLKSDVGELKSDISVLKSEAGELKDQVNGLASEIRSVKNNVAEMSQILTELNERDLQDSDAFAKSLITQDERLSNLENEIKQLK